MKIVFLDNPGSKVPGSLPPNRCSFYGYSFNIVRADLLLITIVGCLKFWRCWISNSLWTAISSDVSAYDIERDDCYSWI